MQQWFGIVEFAGDLFAFAAAVISLVVTITGRRARPGAPAARAHRRRR